MAVTLRHLHTCEFLPFLVLSSQKELAVNIFKRQELMSTTTPGSGKDPADAVSLR
jgi:hypothetical protein